MMMGSARTIAIIFSGLFFLSGCQSADQYTVELKHYLKENFNMEATNGELYLFVPSDQYQNWFVLDGKKLSASLKKKLHVFSGFAPINITGFSNYHYDKDSKLMQLKFIDYSNKLIVFESGRIESLVELVNL